MIPDFYEQVQELTKLDRKSLSQRAMKLAEESGEVSAAVLRFQCAHGTNYKPDVTAFGIAEEAIDSMIVAASILADMHQYLTDDEVKALVRKKLAKWLQVLQNDGLR